MTVDTKTAPHRREVHYDSLDDLQQDIRQFASGDVETLGNWSFGQIMMHLAIGFNGSLDGLSVHVPWFIKIAARLFMKKRFLEGPLPSGFQIGKRDREKLVPPVTVTTERGLAALEAAIERLKQEPERTEHPVLGHLTSEEWMRFHLRHAELHMSFVRAA